MSMTPRRGPSVLLHTLGIATALVLALADSAGAAPIIIRTGPDMANTLGGVPITHGRAVQWVSTLLFEDVSVTADLSALPGRSGEATAYLTTSLGPGTTLADEVARATVALPDFSAASNTVTLFAGLTLPAGHYYLIVTPGATDGIWKASDPGDITTRVFPFPDPPDGTISATPGFPNYQFVALSSAPAPADPFGPARPFIPFNHSFGVMHFGVDGRLAQDPLPPSVPEPGTLMLLLGGIVVGVRRFRSRHTLSGAAH
jgi:hypothetical protein